MWRVKIAVVILILLAIQNTPYLVALRSAGEDYIFGGFLFNPLDGNSYLAKIEQGRAGQWLFSLPYTAQAGKPAFIFTFYLFLGHLSRWLGISGLCIFHLARITSAVILWLALWRFFSFVFLGDREKTWKAFVWSLFGSGLGWLAFAGGLYTSDYWVAEAYPFLASYANPHFPLGLAILLWILIYPKEKLGFKDILILTCLGMGLAIILPFGVVIALVVHGIEIMWNWIKKRRLYLFKFFALFIGGGALLFYEFWSIQSNQMLLIWNRQNITPAPPIWDLILSLSPAIWVGFWAIFKLIRQRQAENYRLLIIWVIAGLILIYLPFNLQRRFMLGLYIPIVGLATLILVESIAYTRTWIWLVFLILSLPTNGLLLLAGFHGIQTHDQRLYLLRTEGDAIEWIQKSAKVDSIVLCASDTGMYVPARAGLRVVYGHPFETVNAEEEKENVTRFFSGQMSLKEAREYLISRGIDFIFYGPREKKLGYPAILAEFNLAYQNKDVDIYRVSIE